MTIDTDSIIGLLMEVAGERQIQITVQKSFKGAMICGAASFLGGLVAGPVGLAAGGTIGGLAAYCSQQGQFKPVSQVLNELSYERKERIADQVNDILTQMEVNDLAQFAQLAIVVGTVVENGNVTNAMLQRFIQESVAIIQREITSS
jgi:hypothetical protein